MNTRRSLLLFLIVAGCTNSNSHMPIISDSITPDGQINERVWKRSMTIDLPEASTLHLMQNDEDIMMAIKFDRQSGNYVDVYLRNDSIGTINLHASMQLGERLLENNWNDTIPAWNWGNNQGWTANTIRYKEHNEKLKLMDSIEPYEGFEFTVSKQKILQNKVWIRIEIRDFTGTGKNYYYPEESTREDTNSWLEVSL